MRVIINADDCGMNTTVNRHIEQAIDSGKITSTTIMANMGDIEGALALYERFHDSISFGIHLNLTEGEPIIKSKELLNYGYYSEDDGRLVFSPTGAESFRYKCLPNYIKKEIFEELSAQISRLQKLGINISHLDSHHHIHTSFSLFNVIAHLSKEFNIPKVRRIRNYKPISINFYGRQAWFCISKFYNKKYVMTDYFAIFKEFFDLPRISQLNANSTVELMVHPGHSMENFQKEEIFMLETKYPTDFDLINYNQL